MDKFKFNPDKKVGNDGIGSDFTNLERAERGYAAVELHPDSTGLKAVETSPEDIIADIFHFCDSCGIDVDKVLDRAKLNWQAER